MKKKKGRIKFTHCSGETVTIDILTLLLGNVSWKKLIYINDTDDQTMIFDWITEISNTEACWLQFTCFPLFYLHSDILIVIRLYASRTHMTKLLASWRWSKQVSINIKLCNQMC